MMILADYNQFGGVHSEFGALQNVLAYAGVTHPETGEPLSEALLFGIGAGVGASYFNFVYEGFPPGLSINMVGRYKAKYGELLKNACERLGLTAVLKTTKSEKAALGHLKKALAAGQPAIVEVYGGFGAYQCQEYETFAEIALVVYGIDEEAGTALVASQATQPTTLTLEELAGRRGQYGPLKNLSLTVEAGAVDVKTAVAESISRCAELILNPPTPKGNFGLNALKKWADLVVDTKGKKGWLNVFTPGTFLYNALAGTFAQIEMVGVDGGGLRGLYADFLEEAAQLLEKPELAKNAARYREAAAQWTVVAETALPDSVDLFKESKVLMRQKWAAFLAGETAVLADIQQRQTEIHAQMETEFPLDTAACLELLQTLHAEIMKLHAIETEAATMLQAHG